MIELISEGMVSEKGARLYCSQDKHKRALNKSEKEGEYENEL